MLNASILVSATLKQVWAGSVVLRRGRVGPWQVDRRTDSRIRKSPDGNSRWVRSIWGLIQIQRKRRRAKIERTVEETCVGWSVSDAVAAPHYNTLRCPISGAHSRSDIPMLNVPQVASVAFCAGEGQSSRGTERISGFRIKRGQTVVSFGDGRLQVPAKSEVDREPRGGAPVVLAVHGKILVREGRGHGLARRNSERSGAEQKTCGRVAGHGSGGILRRVAAECIHKLRCKVGWAIKSDRSFVDVRVAKQVDPVIRSNFQIPSAGDLRDAAGQVIVGLVVQLVHGIRGIQRSIGTGRQVRRRAGQYKYLLDGGRYAEGGVVEVVVKGGHVSRIDPLKSETHIHHQRGA